MLAFTTKEMISSTDAQRGLGGVLDSLKNHTLNKVGFMRNNTVEAVVYPIDVAEKLEEAFGLMEHVADFMTITHRENVSLDNYLDPEDVFKAVEGSGS